MAVKFFIKPWAVSGNKATVPNDVQSNGSVSYDSGYGIDYSLDPTSAPAALNVERVKFNQLMYDVTNNIRNFQIFGAPDFITSADNNGTAFSYSAGAKVRYTDGKYYESLVDTNTALPTVTANWRQYTPGLASALSDRDYGFFTVTGGIAILDNDVVTYDKLQNVTASSRVLGRFTAGAGDAEEGTLTQVLDMVAVGVRGDILVRGATTWSKLSIGAINTTFTSNGTDPAWSATPNTYINLALRQKQPPKLTWVTSDSISVAGSVLFTTDQNTPITSTAFTKTQTAAWAAGNNAGGMLGGAVKAAGQSLHLFVIYNPTSQLVDYGYATVATAPTLPVGYTEYRRIGSFRCDGSGNIPLFFHDKNRFEYGTSVEYNGGVRSLSLLGLTFVPSGVVLEVLFLAFVTAGTVLAQVITGLGGGAGNYIKVLLGGNTSTSANFQGRGSEITNNLGQIYLSVTGTGAGATLYSYGYIDYRGTQDQ